MLNKNLIYSLKVEFEILFKEIGLEAFSKLSMKTIREDLIKKLSNSKEETNELKNEYFKILNNVRKEYILFHNSDEYEETIELDEETVNINMNNENNLSNVWKILQIISNVLKKIMLFIAVVIGFIFALIFGLVKRQK